MLCVALLALFRLADPNLYVFDSLGNSIVHLAAANGHTKILEMLMAHVTDGALRCDARFVVVFILHSCS